MKIEEVKISELSEDPSNYRNYNKNLCSHQYLNKSSDQSEKQKQLLEEKRRKILSGNKNIKGTICLCSCCGSEFYKFAYTKKKYCSRKCSYIAKRIYDRQIKTCKYCNKEFLYTPRPNSNSPGSYCSIKCRNSDYSAKAPNYGLAGGRPRWRSKRDKFLNEFGNNFCAYCGKREGRLMVHHIEPYRVSKNDNIENLVTLCGKCHSKFEKYSNKIENISEKNRPLAIAIIQAYLQDYWMVHKNES
jgi:hypothetical protein